MHRATLLMVIRAEGVLAVIFRCARLKFLSLTKTSVTARSVRAVSEVTPIARTTAHAHSSTGTNNRNNSCQSCKCCASRTPMSNSSKRSPSAPPFATWCSSRPSLFFAFVLFVSLLFFSHDEVGLSATHQVLDPFAVGQTGVGEGQGHSLFPHTAINEYSEQKLLQMHWQLLR